MSKHIGDIFISYRRAESNYEAKYVFDHLIKQQIDVFMDVENLDSGEFLPIILDEIKARHNFLIILTPRALLRTLEPNDWLKKEFEHARRHRRNIIPVMMKNFTFREEKGRFPRGKVPQMVLDLEKFNGLEVPLNYEDAAMKKLVTRFLKATVNAPITRTDQAVKPVVNAMITNAKHARATPNEWLFPQGRLPIKPFLSNNFNATRSYQIKAPQLTLTKGEKIDLSWNTVLGAMTYKLEVSGKEDFSTPFKLYEGDQTRFSIPRSSFLNTYSRVTLYYRVRAQGGSIFGDSAWSNVVSYTFVPPQPNTPPLSPPSYDPFNRSYDSLNRWSPSLSDYSSFNRTNTWRTPATPFLEKTSSGLRWNTILLATGYSLEASLTEGFSKPIQIYQGTETSYTFPKQLNTLNKTASGNVKLYYRVKAHGVSGADSSWSNTVLVTSFS